MGNTREAIGSQSADLKTDETPIPAVIHVSYNQLDNPRTFEKIFTDRVLLAPVVDTKGPGARAKKANVTSLHHAQRSGTSTSRSERSGTSTSSSERTRGVGRGILVKRHHATVRGDREDRGEKRSGTRSRGPSHVVGDVGV